jgi:hypothetical protein
MVGGMISSAVLTLLVIPVIYALIKQHTLASAYRLATDHALPSATHHVVKERK